MDGTPGTLSGTFAGRYSIERELGHGATATVYLARDIQRNRTVAIKVLRPELAQSVGADRFLREIKVNEQLHHPHIVPVYDSGEYDGQLFFVLPHMEGGSLRVRMQREKQLPIEEAVAIARTIAGALDYAHQRGLIHRDVKPENILFTGGQACLGDFGIARAIERTIDESTTSTGLVRGTPAYMSPEQASGSKQYDGRSDIYSLACVLYELIAGIPAFIGPTPEAVIAQRFTYAPRELRVYRQTVPPALEAAIHRALALTPADRYATASEFANALETAQRVSRVEPRTSGPTLGLDRSKRIALAGAALFVAAVAIAALTLGRGFPWNRSPGAPDTSRVVVLPLQGTTTAGMDLSFRAAFARWTGITVPGPIDVNDAIEQRKPLLSRDVDAGALAAALDAGRYVRGRIQRVATGFELDVGLYEVPTNRELAHATMRLSGSRTMSDSAYFPVADSLLLRGSVRAIGAGTSSLPAAQTFAAALHAVDDWDLQRADSLLQAARSYDPTFPLAAFRLAQVRSWRAERPERWLSLAEIAASDSVLLPLRERRMVAALIALGERRYADACAIYNELRRSDSRDFAAWFGLGRCHADDAAVLRDAKSPSGWRFRSSSHQAVLAYARAFELLPTVYRGFRLSAYEPLRRLLFARTSSIREGVALPPDTGAFYARPMWRGDTLALIPYPAGDFSRARTPAEINSIIRAMEQQRALFRRIALAWSAALPQSAGAKEAVAIALDMTGDPSALDTIRLVRRLTTDPSQLLRLATSEAIMLVKFGVPGDLVRLRAARWLADSLLKASESTQPGDARHLGRLAAMTGQCELATDLAARDPEVTVLPSHIEGASQALAVGALMGCRRADDAAFRRIADAIAANVADPRRREPQVYLSLLQAAWLAESPDTGWVARLAGTRSGTVLSAKRDLMRGDTASARAGLRALRALRGDRRAVDVTLDALLAEARLSKAMGDTALAVSSLAAVLNSARLLPEEALADEVGVASFMRLIELYAQLTTGSAQKAWREALAILQAPQP